MLYIKLNWIVEVKDMVKKRKEKIWICGIVGKERFSNGLRVF